MDDSNLFGCGLPEYMSWGHFGDSGVWGNQKSLREEFLAERLEPCVCCALGSLLVSTTLYVNKCSVNTAATELGEIEKRIKNGKEFSNGFEQYFSKEQLIWIEIAFEGGVWGIQRLRG